MYKILVCDDEADIRSALRIYLSSEDYEIFEAENGKKALEIIEREEIHLLLMDIMMPKKNGIAACSEIRAADPLVPILSFTAMPSDMAMLRTLGSGADDYIPKDRPPEEFLARVNAAVRKAAPLMWMRMSVLPQVSHLRIIAVMLPMC